MPITVSINGYFDMTIYYINSNQQVTAIEEQEIQDKLKTTTYLMGMSSRTISAVDDLSTALYRFELNATHATEYEF